MKRIGNILVYILLILVSVSMLLIGCAGSSMFEGITPEERPGEKVLDTPENEKINIQFAQWSVSSSPIAEEVINVFNASNEEQIYIDMIKIPIERYIETLNMLNSSGEGPDVYEIIYEWLGSYGIKGWICDMSSYTDENFLEAFPSWAVEYGKDINNKLFSLPSNMITYRLIYNKDLFRESGIDPEAPPKTLSEFERYANIISEKGKGKRKYGFAQPMGAIWLDFVMPLEALNGYSGIYFYDHEERKYNVTAYEPWLRSIQNLNRNGGIFPGMHTMKSDLAMTQFAEGNIGMMFAASWQVSDLINYLQPKCNWGVAMPPAIDEESIGKGSVCISTAGWYVVNTKTKHLNEAIKVWKYLYSKEYLGELFAKSCIIPVPNNILKDRLYRTIDRNFEEFLPGDKDALYLNTPRNADEWRRKDAYVEALYSDNIGEILLKENYRLNSLIDY